MQLRGANALITGAAGALGAPIAHSHAREGCSLVLTDLAGDALDSRARELSAAGTQVVSFGADLRDPNQLGSLVRGGTQHIFRRTTEARGRI